MVLIWLLVGVSLLLAELMLTELTSLMLAFGAFAAAILAWMALPLLLQGLGFALVVLGSVVFLRPLLRHKIQPAESQLTADAFVGQEACVLEPITPDQQGRIKIHGEIWNASAYDNLPLGETVIITRIHNNIAEVVSKTALTVRGDGT